MLVTYGTYFKDAKWFAFKSKLYRPVRVVEKRPGFIKFSSWRLANEAIN